MTDEYALGQIVGLELEWHEDGRGGFVAQKNGITVRIRGSSSAFIMLTVTEGHKSHTIHEPRVLIWKKPPPIKRLMQAILDQAIQQTAKHHTEEYQNQIRNELFEKLIGWNS